MGSNTPIKLDPGRNPWDQQPRESELQYNRFLLYRDSGRMRSLTDLNKLLTGIGDNLKYGTIRIQSHTFRWGERARAWDRHQDAKNQEAVDAARKAMIDRHQRIAGALISKALGALKAIRDDSEIAPADIVRFIKLATDLEARALGSPHQTIALTGPTGGPVQTESLTGLSDEARRLRLREIVDELSRRVGDGDDEQ